MQYVNETLKHLNCCLPFYYEVNIQI